MSRNPSVIERFWRWYTHMGPPLEFYTSLTPQQCIQRLTVETVNWDNWNPFGLKPYKSQVLYDGTFKVKSRRVGSEKPFVGKFEPLDDGGTRVTGHITNDNTSFLGFVAVLLVAGPIVGAIFYNRIGFVIGLLIGLMFVGSTIYARMAEEESHAGKAIKRWLMKTLPRFATYHRGQIHQNRADYHPLGFVLGDGLTFDHFQIIVFIISGRLRPRPPAARAARGFPGFAWRHHARPSSACRQ